MEPSGTRLVWRVSVGGTGCKLQGLHRSFPFTLGALEEPAEHRGVSHRVGPASQASTDPPVLWGSRR